MDDEIKLICPVCQKENKPCFISIKSKPYPFCTSYENYARAFCECGADFHVNWIVNIVKKAREDNV